MWPIREFMIDAIGIFPAEPFTTWKPGQSHRGQESGSAPPLIRSGARASFTWSHSVLVLASTRISA